MPVDFIGQELEKEETKFRKTLTDGLKELEKIARQQGDEIWSNQIFDLYQSYGFPPELSLEIAKEKNIKVSARVNVPTLNAVFEIPSLQVNAVENVTTEDVVLQEIKSEIQKHQELSRTASVGMFKGGLADSGEQTTKLHTAAHLMLAALRQVLGGHVMQRGSNITAERLRFDFSHPEKMTPDQINQVEVIVNGKIAEHLLVNKEEMSLDDARANGAMGVFGSKYGERVTVYTIGGFSKEICGGPHVGNTGKLGTFRIIKEESSSSGVRRVKAVLM